MSAFGALDRGTRIAILLLGAASAAGIGYLGWQMTRPAPMVEASAKPEPQPEAAAPDPAPASPAAETAAAPDPAAEPEPALPLIDTWRVSADGEAVVSGSAEPGATVEVVVDDVTVASGAATASGEFAILFTLAPNPKPSLMWLSMQRDGLPPVASEEMVALGPIEGPKLAATMPEAAPEGTGIAAAGDTAPPPALLLSEEGAVLLQEPQAPEIAPEPAADSSDEPPAGQLASVMIDTISYTPEGEVQVGGRGAGGAGLRLYLDNAELTTLQIPATGRWVTTLPDTAPGIYTLRVDQLDASGKVVSRFETPFKRETIEALASAAETPEPAPQELAAVADAPAQPQVAPAENRTETRTEADTGPQAEASTDAPPEPETAAPEAPAAPQADPVATAPEAPVPVSVTVQPGFTLWGIAQERWGDGVLYVQVFEANKDKIKDPDLIYPGQVFSMPEAAP